MGKKKTDYGKTTQREKAMEGDEEKSPKLSQIQQALLTKKKKDLNQKKEKSQKGKVDRQAEQETEDFVPLVSVKAIQQYRKAASPKQTSKKKPTQSEDDLDLTDSDDDFESEQQKQIRLEAPSRVIFINRLPFGLFDDQLNSFFRQFGPLQRVIHPKTKAGKSKHFAFVVFQFAETAQVAAKALHGYVFENHVMQCRNLTCGEWKETTLKAKKKQKLKKAALRVNFKDPNLVAKNTVKRKLARESKRKKAFQELGIPLHFLKD